MSLQIGSAPSYLIRNPYSYCFRMRVPVDLQPQVGRKELRYSLKTGYLSEAKIKARILAGQVQLLFKNLRKGTGASRGVQLSDTQIQEMTKQHLRDLIKEYDEPEMFDRYDNLERQAFREDYSVEEDIDYYAMIKQDYIRDLQIGNYGKAEPVADTLLARCYPDLAVDKSSSRYWKLCAGILRAMIKGTEYKRDSLSGNISDEVEHMLVDCLPGSKAGNRGHERDISDAPIEPEQTSATLEEAYNNYWDENSHSWKPRTTIDYKVVREHILKTLRPDTQLHTLDYGKLKKFRNGLRSGELSSSGKPLSIDRVNLFISTLKEMYDIAMREDKKLDRVNPAEGLRLKDKRKPSSKQDIFTFDELKVMFCDSKEYGQDKHTKAPNFWVPVLALFTGARLDELCQLLTQDVIQREGLWCLDIREDNAAKKSVKTGERRVIPLHPLLVDELRFPQFVESIDRRKKRVFHELTYVNKRWGHGLSQWFTKFRNRAGVTAPSGRKTFHSFRHTFINSMKQNGVGKDYVKEYVGHKGRMDIDWDLYGKEFKPDLLMKHVVLKLNYPLDFTHLKESKWVVK